MLDSYVLISHNLLPNVTTDLFTVLLNSRFGSCTISKMVFSVCRNCWKSTSTICIHGRTRRWIDVQRGRCDQHSVQRRQRLVEGRTERKVGIVPLQFRITFMTMWHNNTWDNLTWHSMSWFYRHWSSNLSRVVVTIHTRVGKRKRSTKMSLLFLLKQVMTTAKKRK